MLCEINETDDLKVAKFIAGLREDIGRKLVLIPNQDLPLAFNMATIIDQGPTKRKVSNHDYHKNPRNFSPRNHNSPPKNHHSPPRNYDTPPKRNHNSLPNLPRRDGQILVHRARQLYR